MDVEEYYIMSQSIVERETGPLKKATDLKNNWWANYNVRQVLWGG